MSMSTVGERRSRWGRVALLTPLRHRVFRLLFVGQVVSDLGDWLDLLALLTLIVYQWRLGAPALAALTMTVLLPSAFVAPFSGVLVDRWPRKRVLVACDVVRAGLSLALVWAPGIGVVLMLVLARSTAGTLFTPARIAAVRLTVPPDDLLQANALGRLSVNVAKVAGPGLGAALVAFVGPHGAFVADALSFAISAVLLARLALRESDTQGTAAPSQPRASRWLADLRAGVVYIARSPVLAVAVGAQMAEMLVVETNDSFTVLALKGVGMSAALVGLAIGCSGLGNVVGALGLGQWGHRRSSLRLMGSGMLLVGIVEAALGGALVAGLGGGARWFLALILAGVGFAAIWVPYNPGAACDTSRTSGPCLVHCGCAVYLAGPARPSARRCAHRAHRSWPAVCHYRVGATGAGCGAGPRAYERTRPLSDPDALPGSFHAVADPVDCAA